MGQKINPIGLRLGINRTWDSRWFAGKAEYGKLLHEDVKIREILHKELKQAAVARIVIERPHKKCRVTIHSARPGVVIGKKGADIDKLRKKVADMRLRDHELVDIEIVVVLGIGDRRLQALLDVDRDPLARELQVGKRGRRLAAADHLRDQVELLRAHPKHPGDRLGLIVGEAPFAL